MRSHSIAFVGLGALGSFALFFLSKRLVNSGAKFVLVDPDYVEWKNLGNQLYVSKHVGLRKVEAMKLILKELDERFSVDAYSEKLEREDVLKDVELIVATTDNLESRRRVNEISEKLEVPWVYAGISNNEMMLSFIENRLQRKRFAEIFKDKEDTKSEIPLFSVLVFSSILSERLLSILEGEAPREFLLERYVLSKDLEVYREIIRG